MKNSTLTSLLIGLLCLYTVNSQCPVFYGDYNQQGDSFQQCSSGNVANNWNDQVSSFVVPAGYTVQLYADGGYGGKTYGPYSAGSYNVPADFNDQLSSIKISKQNVPAQKCPTFYGDYQQQGDSFQQCSSGNVASSWNDQVSSFVVPAGYTVQLYADGGYGGKTYGPYSAGSYDVPADFNDQLSSIRISQAQSQPKPQPKPQPDNNGGYVQLSNQEINSSPIINDLAQLGSEYLLERALFVDNKYNNLPNSPYTITGIDSIWKKYAGKEIWYSFYVQLKSQESDKRLRTTYVVSFNPTSGDTQVIDYSYSVRDAQRPYYVDDLPEFVPLDSVASGGDLRSELQRGVNFVVADAIKTRQISKGNYRAGTTFSVMNDNASPVSSNIFLTTIVNSSGYTYRVRITVPDVDNSSNRRRGNNRITYEIYPNY